MQNNLKRNIAIEDKDTINLSLKMWLRKQQKYKIVYDKAEHHLQQCEELQRIDPKAKKKMSKFI